MKKEFIKICEKTGKLENWKLTQNGKNVNIVVDGVLKNVVNNETVNSVYKELKENYHSKF